MIIRIPVSQSPTLEMDKAKFIVIAQSVYDGEEIMYSEIQEAAKFLAALIARSTSQVFTETLTSELEKAALLSGEKLEEIIVGCGDRYRVDKEEENT